MYYRVRRKRIQGESPWVRLINSPLAFLLTLGLFVLSLYPTLKAFLAWRAAKEEQVKIERELQSLESEAKELEDQKVARQDPAFQELEARRLYGLKKPGEEVIVIVPPQTGGELAGSRLQVEKKEEEGWWAGIISKVSSWFR